MHASVKISDSSAIFSRICFEANDAGGPERPLYGPCLLHDPIRWQKSWSTGGAGKEIGMGMLRARPPIKDSSASISPDILE
jgi:hypothetical protein